MSLSTAVFFGLIQGVTEFLPISSSGHLLLFRQLLSVYDQPLTVDIVLHLGSLLAIVIFFRSKIKKNLSKLILPLTISLLPAALIGFFLLTPIETLFISPRFLGYSFGVTTIILLLFNHLKWGKINLNQIKSFPALKIGLFQALAIIPGISRSASTILAGKIFGLNPLASFSFAFLMAIPAILASLIFSFLKLKPATIIYANPLALSAGFFASLISSFFSLRLLQFMLKRKNLSNFAFYTIILTTFSLALFV